jgi:ribonuclease BN (tRNA processing enzyme)
MQLTILGGGGWVPAHGRHTACALLRDRDDAILIDAGTGVARLLERPELLAGLERLDIVLTHFHLDHVTGLAYLPALGFCPQTTVWGPGALLYGTPTEELLARVSNQPFNPVPLEEQDVEVRDVPPGELELGEIRIETRRQDRHSAPTLGLRFGDELAWITDTAYDPDSQAFASGCRVLAHEAWFVTSDPRNPEIHCSARNAAEVAAAAGSERLLLIHMPPFERDLAPLEEEARAVVPAVTLAHDGADVSTLLASA